MENSKVYFSISQLKIKTAQFLLKEAGIQSFVINKMDSAHPQVFSGDIELYVDSLEEDKAYKLLVSEGIISE